MIFKITLSALVLSFSTIFTYGKESSKKAEVLAVLPDDKLKAFFDLPQEEQFKRGVTTVDDPNKGSAVIFAPIEFTKEIKDTLSKANIGVYGSCGRGHCGWYVLQKDFNKARELLLKNRKLEHEHIHIATPDLSGL